METGLLDVQLEPHNNAATEIELEEENHEVFKINLMNYPHVVQKYADPLFVYFDRMIQQEEIQYLKQSLASLCDLFYLRAKKGYTDQKKINEFVLGFKEGVAQQLEVVGLSKCEKGYAQPFDELKKKYEELKFIIICRYPELDMFLSKLIQEKLDLYKIDVDFI
ncbi:MAG: hypothetical protein EBZ47_06640 [Chlamydiae bacterium]|nr:hypothetical protein [Chlamydiota bacterium]